MTYFASTLLLLMILLRPISGQSPAGQSPATGPDPPVQSNPLAVNPLTGLTPVAAANYHPLTGKQRLHLYWNQNFASVGAYFGPVFSALAFDQATGTPAAWGGGFAGYGRRVASRTGSAIVQGTVQAGLAAALHEDVRYIYAGHGGFGHRTVHAIKYSFMTYNNHGEPTLNISNLTSYYAATAISTTWLPLHQSAAKYTAINGTEQLALSIPVNILQEFWPEIRQKVFHRGP